MTETPLKKGTEHTLTIESLAYGGRGVANQVSQGDRRRSKSRVQPPEELFEFGRLVSW